jgi:hypothetical protein
MPDRLSATIRKAADYDLPDLLEDRKGASGGADPVPASLARPEALPRTIPRLVVEPMKCHLCDDEAVAVFEFSHGCLCSSDRIQPLCLHHARKSAPTEGGTMLLIEDLTVDGEFTRYWER